MKPSSRFDPDRRSSSRRAAMLGIWLQLAAMALLLTDAHLAIVSAVVIVSLAWAAWAFVARQRELRTLAASAPGSTHAERGLRTEAARALREHRQQWDATHPLDTTAESLSQ